MPNPKIVHIDEQATSIEGLDVRFARLDDKVVDIQVELTDYEYHALRRQFSDRSTDPKTSCYSGMLQDQLSTFNERARHDPKLRKSEAINQLNDQMWKISTFYAELESLINNPPEDRPIDVLLAAIGRLQANLQYTPDYIKGPLSKELDVFKKYVEANFKGKACTQEQIRHLFAMQYEGQTPYPCLGNLVASQIKNLSSLGMDEFNRIANREYKGGAVLNTLFNDLFDRHPLKKALFKTVAQIDKRAFSAYGARYNNNSDPIDPTMKFAIQGTNDRERKTDTDLKTAVRTKRDLATVNEAKQKANLRYTSLTPYLDRADDLEQVDEVLGFIRELRATKKPAAEAEPVLSGTARFIAGVQVPFKWTYDALVFVLGTAVYLVSTPIFTFVVRPLVNLIGWGFDVQEAADSFTDKAYDGLNELPGKLSPRAKGWLAHSNVFFGSVIEMVTLAPLRLALSLPVGLLTAGFKSLVNGGFYLASILYPPVLEAQKSFDEAYDNFVNRFLLSPLDKLLRGGFLFFSPLVTAKEQRNDMVDVPDPLKKNLNKPDSQFDLLLNRVSSENVNHVVSDGVETLLRSITRPLRRFFDLQATADWWAKPNKWNWLVNPKQYRADKTRENFEKYQERSLEKFLEAFEARTQKKTMAELSKHKETDPEAEEQAKQTAREREEMRHEVKPWVKNEMSSPMDFFDEILVTLSDTVVDQMFIESPGFATGFFMVAATTLFSLVPLPAFIVLPSLMKTIAGTPGAVIAKSFMGKSVGQQFIFNNFLASFLEWKLAFFTVEGIKEGLEGHLGELMGPMLKNPEKYTLGFAVMVASGYALSLLPHLPSAAQHIDFDGHHIPTVYPDILETFIEEAKQVTEGGLPPLTSIEYGFLSLKLGFLVENLLSGGVSSDLKKPNHKHKELFKAMDKELKNTPKDQWNKTSVDQIIADLNQKYNIIPMDAAKALELNTALYDHVIQKMIKEKHKELNSAKLSDILENDRRSGFVNPVIRQFYGAANNEAEERIEGHINAALNDAKKANDQYHEIDEETTKIMKRDPALAERKALVEALGTLKRMQRAGDDFDNESDAAKFFNHLDDLYDALNQKLRDKGYYAYQVDKGPVMDDFYQTYLEKYHADAAIFRFLSYIPFFPVTLSWRAAQWVSVNVFNLEIAPATAYERKKRNSGDLAVFWQSVYAAPGRMLNALKKPLIYSGRFLVFVTLVAPLAAVPSILSLVIPPLRKPVTDFVLGAVNAMKFALPSDISFSWKMIRGVYAEETHKAGRKTKDTLQQTTQADIDKLTRDQIELGKAIIEAEKQQPNPQDQNQKTNGTENLLLVGYKLGPKDTHETLTLYEEADTANRALVKRVEYLNGLVEALDASNSPIVAKNQKDVFNPAKNNLNNIHNEIRDERMRVTAPDKKNQKTVKEFINKVPELNKKLDEVENKLEALARDAKFTPGKVYKPR
jgi:hypothetical protein